MKAKKGLRNWGLLFILIGGWGAESLTAESIQEIETVSGDRAFAFRLSTPQLTLQEPVPGSYHIEIDGFGTPQRHPGAPSIPTHTLLVAIPPGALPRLDVRVVGEHGGGTGVPLGR